MSFKRKYPLSLSLFCLASRGTFIQLMCDFPCYQSFSMSCAYLMCISPKKRLSTFFFVEPHKYQLWVYIYQARDLIAKDESGMNGRCSLNALTSGYIFNSAYSVLKGRQGIFRKSHFADVN